MLMKENMLLLIFLDPGFNCGGLGLLSLDFSGFEVTWWDRNRWLGFFLVLTWLIWFLKHASLAVDSVCHMLKQ